LAESRGGTAKTCTTTGSPTAVHKLPAFGTYVVGDTLVNKSWSDSNDWMDAVCTTAGAVGTAVFTERFAGRFGDYMVTLSAGDTTPDVTDRGFIRTANTSGTTITGLEGGVSGQKLIVFVNDGNTTIAHNGAVGSETPIYLSLGSDYVCSSGDVLMFAYAGTYWHELRPTISEAVDCYAEIYCKDASTAQTVTASTPTKVDGFTTNGQSSNMTADASNDKLTVTHAGKYLVTLQCSFSGSSSSTVEIFIRSGSPVAETTVGFTRKLGTAGDVGSASCVGFIDCSVGDDIEAWVESDNTSFTPQQMQLTAHRVG
jgi:hypothetical protein